MPNPALAFTSTRKRPAMVNHLEGSRLTNPDSHAALSRRRALKAREKGEFVAISTVN
jgi:hypothetical protein